MRDVRRTEAWATDKTASHWMVMARTAEDLGSLAHDPAWTAPPAGAGEPLWTDDFSNILNVLQLRLR
jgi:hypothetical protein